MIRLATTTLLAAAFAAPALAHDGRRFEVQIVGDRLVAQGYISGAGATDDGGGLVRPYVNAIHGHFENKTANFATADLPGYDILGNADALIGQDLTMTVTGFMKWTTPAMSGPVNLSPLGAGERIEVLFGGVSVYSDNLVANDTLTLQASVASGTVTDIDLSYDHFGPNPSGEIYVITSVLSTSASGIADSSTIYTLLSPDGATMVERLHHQSLHAEQALAVPEPASLGVLALLPALIRRRRA